MMAVFFACRFGHVSRRQCCALCALSAVFFKLPHPCDVGSWLARVSLVATVHTSVIFLLVCATETDDEIFRRVLPTVSLPAPQHASNVFASNMAMEHYRSLAAPVSGASREQDRHVVMYATTPQANPIYRDHMMIDPNEASKVPFSASPRVRQAQVGNGRG